jgi:hypothetical protein
MPLFSAMQELCHFPAMEVRSIENKEEQAQQFHFKDSNKPKHISLQFKEDSQVKSQFYHQLEERLKDWQVKLQSHHKPEEIYHKLVELFFKHQYVIVPLLRFLPTQLQIRTIIERGRLSIVSIHRMQLPLPQRPSSRHY